VRDTTAQMIRGYDLPLPADAVRVKTLLDALGLDDGDALAGDGCPLCSLSRGRALPSVIVRTTDTALVSAFRIARDTLAPYAAMLCGVCAAHVL